MQGTMKPNIRGKIQVILLGKLLPANDHEVGTELSTYFTASAVLSAAFSVPFAVSLAAVLVACPVAFAAVLVA